jgi:hypothetical protein
LPGQEPNAAAAGINIALQSDDGTIHRYDDVCQLLESYLVSGFTVLPSPGIGGEAGVAQREPNARINCYYDTSSGLPFDEFLRRVVTLLGVLCDRFSQRAVGYELYWVSENAQHHVSGVAISNQPFDLLDLVRKSEAPASEVKEVDRTLIVAVHEGVGTRRNQMLFYKSPDWGGRLLVPSLKIRPTHPNADDENFLLRAFLSKLPISENALQGMNLYLLPGGPKSVAFKFSLDRTKRWEGLKRYSWRVAWCRLSDRLAETIGEHDTPAPDALVSDEVFGLSTLRAAKGDHRNLAANWDVLHLVEDLFGGDTEIVPPNVDR